MQNIVKKGFRSKNIYATFRVFKKKKYMHQVIFMPLVQVYLVN